MKRELNEIEQKHYYPILSLAYILHDACCTVFVITGDN